MSCPSGKTKYVRNSNLFPAKYFIRGAILLLGCFLGFFILYPPCMLAIKSLGGGGSFGGYGSAAGAGHDGNGAAIAGIMRDPATWKAFFTSLRAAFSVTILSTAIGGCLAWIEVKTDFPFKRAMRFFPLLAFIIPPYILGLAWLQFFGRNGYFERLLTAIFQIGEYNLRYYSVGAVVAVMTLHLYPLMYMSLRNALKQQDRNLERAALLSGASLLVTVRAVTLPLLLPSVLSTGLLVFSRTMANFTVPALLALPARKDFLTTRIFSALSGLDLASAAALSILLVAVSTVLFRGQLVFMKKNLAAAHTGEDSDGRPLFLLGKKRYPVMTAVFLFAALTTLLPLGTMLISSFLKRWGLPLRPEYFTLENYRQLLMLNGKAAMAFRNSVLYGVVAAAFALIIGGSTAYLAHTARTKAAGLLEAVASWLMAFPNIVLAVAAIMAWNSLPVGIYGTPWVIILTYMVLFIPIVMKQVSGLIQNHDRSLVAAARLSGASPLGSFVNVTLPAIAPGLKSGFLVCFLIALREIPISLMLYSSGQETLGVLLFGMQSQSYGLEMTSALAMLIIVLILAGNLLIKRGTKRIHNGKTADKEYLQTLWNNKSG